MFFVLNFFNDVHLVGISSHLSGGRSQMYPAVAGAVVAIYNFPELAVEVYPLIRPVVCSPQRMRGEEH